MKILMIIKKLHYSGAPKMFLWVARALSDRGFDVTIFTYMRNDVKDVPVNVKWIQKDLENKNFLYQLGTARQIIRQEKPKCVVSFLLVINIINVLACLGTESKSIVCERNDPFKPHYYVMHLVKPFFRFFTEKSKKKMGFVTGSRKKAASSGTDVPVGAPFRRDGGRRQNLTP